MTMRSATLDLALKLRQSARTDPARTPGLTALLRDGAGRLGVALGDFTGASVVATFGGATMQDAPTQGGDASVAFHLDGCDAVAVATLGAASLDPIVDALYGGDGSEPADPTPRDRSPLEHAIARSVLALAMSALEVAFRDSAPFTSRAIAPKGDEPIAATRPAITVRYELALPGGTAFVVIELPAKALEGLRQAPDLAPPANTPPVDAAWTSALRHEVTRTTLTMRAVLAEPDLSLAALAQMRPARCSRCARRPTPRSR